MAVINTTIAGLSQASWHVVAKSSGLQTFTPNDTAFHTSTLFTLPGNYMQPNSSIRILCRWGSPSINTGTIQVGARIDTTNIEPFWAAMPVGNTVDMEYLLIMNNALNSQIGRQSGGFVRVNQAATHAYITTYSLDFSSDVIFNAYYKTNTSGDDIVLNDWYAEVLL